MSLGRRILASLLFVLLPLLAHAAPTGGAALVAVQGRMALAAVPAEPLPLQGEWGFAWQQFVDPNWSQLPTRAFATVPAAWNDLAAGGKPPGGAGWGSYVLQVDCPAGQALAVEAMAQRTAGRLFINGTLVAEHGVPGPSADQSWAAVFNRTPITRPFACPLRLTLHESNFDHRAGGMVRPILLGTPDALEQQRESRIIYNAFLLSAYLFMGVIALIFYAVRRRERVPLVFGLFCLAMACYTDLIGERLFLRPLPAQVSWFAYMRAEYLTWVAAMALFFLTLRGLFPAEIHKRVAQGVVGTLAVAACAVVLLPPAVYSHAAVPGQAVAVAMSLYVVAAIVRARRRTPADARILLAGMLAIVVALALDLLLIGSIGAGRKFTPIGFALFMLSPAVVIGRRLSEALNAEERNRSLEENARLREDVERMSRHDLKTPLNSILGATRLLRDDPRLNTEQRELVGVLQRSGFRMLEMVNLSLGLFKMETGSYDLRPQAVDLREVATRVLVDLHSYAEANSVTLQLQGEPVPVYVRGEELLCYSILANLVKNAVEAAGPGNRVLLTLEPGETVALRVHNPGEVPQAIAQRFFEKYVTSGKSGGTGLGTYSARLMARAQRGDVSLQTSATQGTTLTLTLPRLKGDAPLPAPAALAEQPVERWVDDIPPRDVLLVDDDEYTRLITRRFLPSPPFDVETAANGQAATEAMARRWPHYLLIDMEMPFKSGIETVQWMRAYQAEQDLPHCHVVMLSGNDDEASAASALAAGADRFLVKPVNREALLMTLRELEGKLQQQERQAADRPTTVTSSLEDEVVIVDPEWLEVFPGFMRSQRETVDAMARALAAGDREDVQFLAHRAFGGLATMGLHWAARQSRVVEQDALHAATEELEHRIAALREHLRKVRVESA
ncbi:response regulator [Ramlibacter sp. XY19]|uniref:hybrid sensor histidine kinase/response regulator n=1 Tax=Ramlibacter paludis TaxID=2908000 RepID=UPI0023DCA5C7|nr:response regulator [Ramlibacter paludis]MCG2593110.1 response regulator [Ramlibacter paludis]